MVITGPVWPLRECGRGLWKHFQLDSSNHFSSLSGTSGVEWYHWLEIAGSEWSN
jgi:hypothetical protein